MTSRPTSCSRTSGFDQIFIVFPPICKTAYLVRQTPSGPARSVQTLLLCRPNLRISPPKSRPTPLPSGRDHVSSLLFKSMTFTSACEFVRRNCEMGCRGAAASRGAYKSAADFENGERWVLRTLQSNPHQEHIWYIRILFLFVGSTATVE